MDKEKIVKGVEMILEAVGEDLNREGLMGTPSRVAKAYAELFSGINQDPRDHLKTCFVEDGHDEIVSVSYTHLTLPTNREV